MLGILLLGVDSVELLPFLPSNEENKQETGCVQTVVSDMKQMTRMRWKVTILDRAVRGYLAEEATFQLRPQ